MSSPVPDDRQAYLNLLVRHSTSEGPRIERGVCPLLWADSRGFSGALALCPAEGWGHSYVCGVRRRLLSSGRYVPGGLERRRSLVFCLGRCWGHSYVCGEPMQLPSSCRCVPAVKRVVGCRFWAVGCGSVSGGGCSSVSHEALLPYRSPNCSRAFAAVLLSGFRASNSAITARARSRCPDCTQILARFRYRISSVGATSMPY